MKCKDLVCVNLRCDFVDLYFIFCFLWLEFFVFFEVEEIFWINFLKIGVKLGKLRLFCIVIFGMDV